MDGESYRKEYKESLEKCPDCRELLIFLVDFFGEEYYQCLHRKEKFDAKYILKLRRKSGRNGGTDGL